MDEGPGLGERNRHAKNSDTTWQAVVAPAIRSHSPEMPLRPADEIQRDQQGYASNDHRREGDGAHLPIDLESFRTEHAQMVKAPDDRLDHRHDIDCAPTEHRHRGMIRI